MASASLKGLLKGDPDGRFRPNDMLTREELVAALVRFAGLEEAAQLRQDQALSFGDVAEWARGYLVAARDAGILPEGEDRFGPGEAVDRLWAAELLVRALGLQDEAELRAGEGLEKREEGKFPAFQGVVTLIPAHDGVAEAMESLLGKFVEVRAERVVHLVATA